MTRQTTTPSPVGASLATPSGACRVAPKGVASDAPTQEQGRATPSVAFHHAGGMTACSRWLRSLGDRHHRIMIVITSHPGGVPAVRNAWCWHPSGMRFFGAWVPVVSLAKPRSTTGYKLPCLRHEEAPKTARTSVHVRRSYSTFSQTSPPKTGACAPTSGGRRWRCNRCRASFSRGWPSWDW